MEKYRSSELLYCAPNPIHLFRGRSRKLEEVFKTPYFERLNSLLIFFPLKSNSHSDSNKVQLNNQAFTDWTLFEVVISSDLHNYVAV